MNSYLCVAICKLNNNEIGINFKNINYILQIKL